MKHEFNPTILRAYDIRGIVDETLTSHDAYMVGRTFATYLSRQGGRSVCVGRDGRLSSPALEAALISGLIESGADVIRIGLGPTPMLYFAQKSLKADGGLMISGSHNPPHHNGIKLTLASRPFFGEDIQHLGEMANLGDIHKGQGTLIDHSIFEAYVERLVGDYSQYYSLGRPLKVAWDAGNGAAGEVIEALTARLPGEHILLNTKIDGTFPAHHPDPAVPENMKQLQATVSTLQCDLGLAFDGDGDRLGIVDAQGRMIWSDQLLILFAEEVLKTHPGANIIADIKSSKVVFDQIATLGGKPIMWKTGHSMIKAKMAETSSILAGEMSGHIFFADRYYGFDDALYAAVRLIGGLSLRNETLAQWYDRLPVMYSTPEIHFQCENGQKFIIIEEIRKALINHHIIHIDIDGVRVSGAEGWWLLRASNTQDILVARMEANTQEGLKALQDQMESYLKPYGLVF
jgi:phosphomannomutase